MLYRACTQFFPLLLSFYTTNFSIVFPDDLDHECMVLKQYNYCSIYNVMDSRSINVSHKCPNTSKLSLICSLSCGSLISFHSHLSALLLPRQIHRRVPPSILLHIRSIKTLCMHFYCTAYIYETNCNVYNRTLIVDSGIPSR